MLKIFDRLVTFSLLQVAIGSFSVLLLGTELHEHGINQADTPRSLWLSIIYALVYVGCAVFSVLYYRRVLASMRVAWPFFAIALLALASTAWSVDPGVTLRRSVVLLGSTVYGVYLGGRYSLQEFSRILLQTFLIFVAASLVMLAVLPAYVVDPSHTSAFRGLTQHKNLFGEYMGLFLLLAITYRGRGGIFPKLGLIVLASAMLLASQSGTSIASTLATVVAMPLLMLLRFRGKQLVPLVIAGGSLVAGAILLGSQQIDALLYLFGKDRTLTGRSNIWEMVLEAIARRPLLGYGFDAFWQGLKGDSLLISASAGWLVPHSHNGYLEALLGLGVAGLGLIGVCALRLGRDGVHYLRSTPGLQGLWPLAFLTYFLVHAMGEPSLLTRDYLSYLLFMAISTSLAVGRSRSAARQAVSPRAKKAARMATHAAAAV